MLMLPIDQRAEQEPVRGWPGGMTTEIKKHTPPYRTPPPDNVPVIGIEAKQVPR